jgi:ribosomal protein L32E
MIVETAKERYKNRTRCPKFKRFHWWEAVRHQPKWRAKSARSSTTDSWLPSSDPAIEEEVTRPIGWEEKREERLM